MTGHLEHLIRVSTPLPRWSAHTPYESVVGCTTVDVAEAAVTRWLECQGVGAHTLPVTEALAALSWLAPGVSAWGPGLLAWLVCLRSPSWTDRSIEDLHRIATQRWPGPEFADQRRTLAATLAGGLAREEEDAWALWIPTSQGFFVRYDGRRAERRKSTS